MILQRVDRPGSDWMLPSPQQFHDLVNAMEKEIISKNLDIISALKWANLWNDTGLIGLSTNDMDRLNKFRDFVHSQKTGGMAYALVPKELVTNKTTITTLLKYNLRNYDLAALPGGIFRRNLDLDGSLVVTKSRIFGVGDKTLKGESKDGWRYVELEADMIFMKILEGFPESHRFHLGSDTIQLWGGKRCTDQGPSGRTRPGRNGNKSQGGTSSDRNGNSSTLPPKQKPLTIDLSGTGGGTAPGPGAQSGLGIPSSNRGNRGDPSHGGAQGGAGVPSGT